jgi:hypothetical protein
MKEAPRVPDFVITDREVLRAFGYFQDAFKKELGPLDSVSSQDSETTVYLTHKVTLFYYVADNTLEVIEQRVPNSGVLGGTLMGRRPCLDDGGQPVSPRSLAVGTTLRLLGHNIHIVDCDARTKDFLLNQHGVDSPEEPLPYPDTPSSFSALDATGLLTPRPRDDVASQRSSQPSPHKKRMDQDMRFHQYEGVVLRFDCVLDERAGYLTHIAAKRYTLLFYMANQTLEVLVQPERGLDVPSTIVSRRILPKNWKDVKDTQRDRVEEEQIVTERDLNIGEVIDVFGKPLLILSCDPFTQRFFQEEFGLRLEPMETPVMGGSEADRHLARKNKPFTIPPTSSSQFLPTYNEVKEEEERKSRKQADPAHELLWREYVRTGQIESDQKIVVELKKVRRNRLEPEQNVILTYYLEDFSFKLYAPPQKNSGVVGGSMMKKGRHLNATPKEPELTGPRLYLPQDFLLGQVLTLPSNQQVQVAKIDGVSLQFLSAFSSLIPELDADCVLGKWKEALRTKGWTQQELQTAILENCAHQVTVRRLLSLLEQEGLLDSFVPQEKLTFLFAVVETPSVRMASLQYLTEEGEEDLVDLTKLWDASR